MNVVRPPDSELIHQIAAVELGVRGQLTGFHMAGNEVISYLHYTVIGILKDEYHSVVSLPTFGRCQSFGYVVLLLVFHL